MKRILFSAGLLCLSLFAEAQCDPVANLNEDFSTFTQDFPQNCWTASIGYPMVSVDVNAANVNIYSFMSTNLPMYLVTPELSTIDGNHQLSFDASRVAGGGTLTLQVGTLSEAGNYDTFQAIGDLITLGTDVIPYNNIVIPASATQKFIAFKVIADGQHMVAVIDNIVWEALPAAPCEALSTITEDFSAFAQDFPQNCWTASHPYPMVSVDTDAADVSLYSSTSPNVPIYLVTPEVSTIDGNHQLSFDASRVPGPGNITLQAGTLSEAGNYDTFQAVGDLITLGTAATTYNNIVIPASATQKFIAFKVIADGQHMVAVIDNIAWDAIPVVPCEAVATINEDFSTFIQDLPQNCWTASHPYPMVSVDTEAADVSLYSSTSPNVPIYLVTPEVSTIDGNHQLSFDASRVPGPGNITLQVGTLSEAGNYDTFQATGDLITLGTAATTYNNIVIPASATQKFIALKVIADGQHMVAVIDNIAWDAIPAVCEAVATINEDFSTFAQDFPQNCWTASHPYPMVSVDTDAADVSLYSSTSPNVPIYLVTPEVSTIDGSHQLSFDASRVPGPGNITLQVGTLSEAGNYDTFQAVGDLITLGTAVTTYNNIVIPASATQKFIALKVIADGQHMVAVIDNIVWSATLSTGHITKDAFAIYPNPVVDELNIAADTEIQNVTIYDQTGRLVRTATSKTVNVSDLPGNIYFVKVVTGTGTKTSKIVKK